jgi:NAD+--asparagine ADP-ribosyltransferase
MDQQFNFLEKEVDKEVIEKTFKNIDKFNEKYRINKFIFDEDIEKRYMRLGVGLDVNTDQPKVKTAPKPKVEPTTHPKKETKPKTKTVKTNPAQKEPKFVEVKVNPKPNEVIVKEKTEKIKVPKEKEVENVIKNKEIGIKDRKTEKAYIFDNEGKVVFEKSGNKTGVKFTTDELSKMKGNVLTHNHPNGTSFSSEDIKVACDWNLKEVRAVGNNNIYAMKMKDGSNFNTELWDKKISSEFDKQLKLAENDHYDQLKRNKITIHEYTRRVYNQTWDNLVKNVPEIEFRMEGI